MKRDPFYQQLLHGLSQPLDPDLFERCAADILRHEWPTLVPVRGGNDAGMDGAVADGNGTAFPLICTTGTDVIGNLTRSLASYISHGKERRRALLATSQILTAKRRQNLEKRAKEKGFTLVHIYDQAAMADRLYRNSAWCRELLNLTGNPPALSIIPLTSRHLLDIAPVGREEDIAWLWAQQQDCLLVGQPGCGKTFLLHDFAKAGGGLFVISEYRGEIAASLREQQPAALILDDAHIHLDLLTQLQQLRQETGLSFKIIACCWPGQKDEVRELLSLPDSQIHDLELLTRDQILTVIKSAGIYGSDELLRELIDQSEGRPGLAVTLAHLCLQGSVQEVALGNALSRSIRTTFEPLVGKDAIYLLAGFAIGGKSGIPMAAVAEIFKLQLIAVQRDAVSLAAGGVIQQLSGNRLAVRPAGLRHALVRDMFFRGAFSLPIEPFLSQVPNMSDAIHTLLGARSRGGDVPDDLLLPNLEKLNEKQLWEEYAFLGQRETDYVLHSTKVPIADFAAAALYYQPDDAILRLLDTATLDTNFAPSLPTIQKWIQETEPGKDEAIKPRRSVLEAVQSWLTGKETQKTQSPEASERETDVAAQAIAYALSPKFEQSTMDPGLGNTFRISRGTLSIAEARGMNELWDLAFQILKRVPPTHWKAIMQAVEDWAYPQRHGVDKAHSELAQVMRKLARKMIIDLIPQFSQHPGLLTRLKQHAAHLHLRLKITVDSDFTALFPNRFSADWRRQEKKQIHEIQKLSKRWKWFDPVVAANRFKQFEEEANGAGLSWPRLIPQLCYELAPQVQNPAEWVNAFFESELSAQFTRPFLDEVVKARQGNWEEMLHVFLNDPIQCGAALPIVLMLKDPSPHLLDQALQVTGRFTQDIELCCSRDEVPVGTVLRLLRNEQSLVATAAAIGLWTANPRGVISEELLPDWKQAILKTKSDNHWIGEILSADPTLTEDWLRARLAEDHDYYFRLNDSAYQAISTLDETARINLLPLIPDHYGVNELIKWLVGTSHTMFGHLLQTPHLKRYHLFHLASAGENMGPMIVQALDSGYGISEVAMALYPASWSWDGKASLMWKQRTERFDKLSEDPDERVRQVATAARKMTAESQKQAEDRERLEAIYGRNR